jgi:type IV secretory pathway VirB10-like protein
MRLASAIKVRFTNKTQTRERASIRIVFLALVSFFLGVAATVFWFHLAAKRDAENPGFPTSSQPSAGQPAAPTISAQSPTQPAIANPPPIDPAAIEEVKRAIPNFASISLEDGQAILRQAALKEFTAAAKEMDAQVQDAQQQLSEAQNGQSEDQQQAAMKHLQQTQAAQAQKLQQIAARLQAQIAALKKLKNPE